MIETVDGLEALKAVRQSAFDLVLMDMHMPVMDGLEATLAIRAGEPAGRRVPIIAMTANVMPEARQACKDAGMDDFLPKPFVREELIRVLGRWLADKSSVRPATAPAAPPPAPAASPPAQISLDRTMLELLMDATEEDFAPLVASFLESTARLLDELDQALHGNQHELAYRHAHTLKSSSANLGATVLSSLARALEAQARKGSFDDGPRQLAAMRSEFERVARALAAPAKMGSDQLFLRSPSVPNRSAEKLI